MMNIHSSLVLVPSDDLLVLTLEAATTKSTNQAPRGSISVFYFPKKLLTFFAAPLQVLTRSPTIPSLRVKAAAIVTALPKAPIPVITPIAAPPIAALCKKANGVPAATNPNDECHAVAILPATGPSAPKPITSRIAGIAQVSPRIVMPPKTPNARYGWARIQSEMSFRRLRIAGLRRLTAQGQYYEP